MAHNALLEYIRQAKQADASNEEIHQRLNAAGWYTVDIQDALTLYAQLTSAPRQPTPPPSLSMPKFSGVERSTPRHYDPHIITVAAVSFVIGFLGYLFLID
jgi:hypothetical protein